ncbi:protein RCC2 homolog isoform X1 [Lampetra fluviatilis]
MPRRKSSAKDDDDDEDDDALEEEDDDDVGDGEEDDDVDGDDDDSIIRRGVKRARRDDGRASGSGGVIIVTSSSSSPTPQPPSSPPAPPSSSSSSSPSTSSSAAAAAAVAERTAANVVVGSSSSSLEGAKFRGQLLICGATNWDLVGRREVPKQQAAFRNLGQNLWAPHRYGSLRDIAVSRVITGPCAAHSLLISTRGLVYSWGRGEKGQLGHGDTCRVDVPRIIDTLKECVIVDGACGRSHTLCLTDTGTVYAFGENRLGQLGLGNQTDAVPSPTQIVYSGRQVVKVACGAEFSVFIDCDGNLFSFGCPEYGQLGHNTDGRYIVRAQRIEFVCELAPRRLARFIEKTRDGQVLTVRGVVVRDVACGANHTIALDTRGRVFTWGFGGYGRLGHAEQKDELLPRLVKLLDRPAPAVNSVRAGYSCTFAINVVGTLYFWGSTNTSRDPTMYPKAVHDLCGTHVRSLACGKSSILITSDDSTMSWGPWPTYGELGYGEGKQRSSSVPQELKKLSGIHIHEVAMGFAHSLLLARDESEEDKALVHQIPEYCPRAL